MTDAVPIIRPFKSEDRDFIFSSWLRSYWEGCIKYLPMIEERLYYREQHKLIERLLLDPATVIDVACLANDESVIIGWAMMDIAEDAIVHYIYVKHPFRKMGIGRSLIKGLYAFSYTHTTRAAGDISRSKRDISFNPWLLARYQHDPESEYSRPQGLSNNVA